MISVQNVSKVYHLYQPSLRSCPGRFSAFPQGRKAEFWALRNINLRIEKGEVFALLGPERIRKKHAAADHQRHSAAHQRTGSLLAAASRRCSSWAPASIPNSADAKMCISMARFWACRARKWKKRFRASKRSRKSAQFIDRPVKEYSSGMYVRLAFSTAIHVDPEVLIVDEALAVGDAIFASRCVQKFEELRRKNVTVLLVSHDLGLVKRLADRAAFMLDGRIVMQGAPKDAVNRYVGFVLDRERAGQGAREPACARSRSSAKSSFRHGDGASRVMDVRILNARGRAMPRRSGRASPSLLRIRAAFHTSRVSNPVVGILIRNRIGMDIFGTNTRLEQVELGDFEPGEKLEIEFELDCLLSRQEYTLTVAVQYWNGLSQDWLDDVLDFRVEDTKDVAGVLNLNTRVRHQKAWRRCQRIMSERLRFMHIEEIQDALTRRTFGWLAVLRSSPAGSAGLPDLRLNPQKRCHSPLVLLDPGARRAEGTGSRHRVRRSRRIARRNSQIFQLDAHKWRACAACWLAARKIAMQYSPNCAIPYVSLVDGGTFELVRGARRRGRHFRQPDSAFRSALDRRATGDASGGRPPRRPRSRRSVPKDRGQLSPPAKPSPSGT